MFLCSQAKIDYGHISANLAKLTWPSIVYLKRDARASENEPFVDKVDLVNAAPSYALVRFPSGRETTVSLRDVAPTAPESAVTPEGLPSLLLTLTNPCSFLLTVVMKMSYLSKKRTVLLLFEPWTQALNLFGPARSTNTSPETVH